MRVDLLHLLRNLRRSPTSAAAAVLTLALTLGAGTAIFAVVDAVLLTPPAFANPDALVALGEVPVDEPSARPRTVRFATVERWRERVAALATIEGFDGTNLTLTGLGAAERMSVTDVTPGLLTLLGVAPAQGRTFTTEDLGRPLVIVSAAFWRARLAGVPDVVGRELMLGNRPHTIVGVLPESFLFELAPADIWRPLPVDAGQAVASGYRIGVVARLTRPVSPATLAAMLDDVSRTDTPPVRVAAAPLAGAITGGVRGTLVPLAGAAAIAALLAFTNFAGLLTVRSIDRRRELAVRTALGGRHGDIVRQLLLEAGALVTIGAAAGVLMALWITPVIAGMVLFGGVAQRDVAVSWPLVGGVIAVALACAVLCALMPALIATRRNLVDALRRGATAPPRELLVRRFLVSGEVALAFVLLVAVTILGRGLIGMLAIHPGFEAAGVQALQVSLPGASYPDRERVVAFYASLQRALEARLGEGTVGIVDEIPLTGDRGRTLVRARPDDAGREAVLRSVSPGYFDVMRIPVVAGRSFTAADDRSATPRIVISESAVRRFGVQDPPLGRQLRLAGLDQPAEIVGVVGDVKQRALDESPLPTVYRPSLQEPSPSSILVVRSARADAEVGAIVRQEVAQLDRNLPVYGVRPLADVIAVSPGVPRQRVLAAAFSAFATLAVVLGAVGLFGVVAHDVASRRRELALRVAVGADRRRILRATLGQGTRMIGAGVVAGALLSTWTLGALSSRDLTTGRIDASSMALAAGLIVLIGVTAVFPAARRAAGTDPLIALRSE